MPGTVNIYKTRFMLELVEQIPPLTTFLKTTFFNRQKAFYTESVDFDVRKGGMGMAPFVHKRIGSTVLERQIQNHNALPASTTYHIMIQKNLH